MTLTKINHEFAFTQLSYDAKKNIQPCVKLSFYFNKLPEVSYEQFYGHWSTVHADLTVAAKDFGVYKIQRYAQVFSPFQFHTLSLAKSRHQISQTPEIRQKAQSLTGIKILEFDGCSEIWVKSWDDWMNFFNSDEYNAALSPDCKYFMKMPISVYAGEENLVFGEAVPGMGGSDGILRKDLKG